MIDYKLKVIHDEDDTVYLYPMGQSGKDYYKEENNLGDDYIMFLLDDDNLCDTIISDNTDFIRNKIPESID